MRFYYMSIISLTLLVIFYFIVLWIVRGFWSVSRKDLFANIMALTIAAVVLVAPWAEELWIAYHFGQLCKKDAGIVVNKTVEVDGFYDDNGGWGVRQLEASGYKFMEWKSAMDRSLLRVERTDEKARDQALQWYADTNPGKQPPPDYYITYDASKGEKIVVAPNQIDAWRITKIDKPMARYHYRKIDLLRPVSHQIKRVENAVVDVHTGDVLGRIVNYYRGPYWFFIHLSRPTIPCEETLKATRNHGSLIYRSVLKPAKN